MLAEPRCYTRNCKHFAGVKTIGGTEEVDQVVFCKAFPNGIPHEIAYGNNLHLSPYQGDHGIQYELESRRPV